MFCGVVVFLDFVLSFVVSCLVGCPVVGLVIVSPGDVAVRKEPT